MKLKTLFVSFESDLGKHQVPAFRGAMVEKVGRENILFHQHNENQSLRYAYPLIQYKSIQKKPAIMCIGDGVDEIHKFFNQKNWDINLQGEKLSLTIDRLDLNHFNMNVWNKLFEFKINNWLALNEANFKTYKNLSGLTDKISFLENILKANILAFAKGINWTIDKNIELKITDIKPEKTIRYKGNPLVAFDLNFKTNVFLPNHLGLGKSVSHGFGTVWQVKNHSNKES